MTETTDQKRLFISHSSADKAFVNKLIKRLDDHGIERPWYDVFELPAGTEDLTASISDGIRNASAFVLILSSKAADSHWVDLEISVAQQSEIPILVLMYNVDNHGALLASGHPRVAEILNGGRRKVIDFKPDPDKAFLDFLDVVAPTAGLEPRIEQVLSAILDDDDPDAAELQMTFAALDAEPYIERLVKRLPEMRDDLRLNYRVSTAFAHIGSEAIERLVQFLLLAAPVDGDGRSGAGVAPTEVDPETGLAMYTGEAFTDFLRSVVVWGGNRAWAAQLGASTCLIAIARHDPAARRQIEEYLERYLKAIVDEVPATRGHEIDPQDWDRLRMTLQTIRDLAPKNAHPWLIQQFASHTMWGDNGLEAARKVGSYIVTCLSAFQTADACGRLFEIAQSEPVMRAVWFENELGHISPNPWESCFVPFGARAVDRLVSAARGDDEAFGRYARLNLARLSNPRAQVPVIAYLEGDGWSDDVLYAIDLIHGMGLARDPAASTRLLELFLSGHLDPIATSETWHDHVEGVAAAIAVATDDQVAEDSAIRLSESDSHVIRSWLTRSISERRMVTLYGRLDDWRTTAEMPYVRGRAAIGLAAAGFFRNSGPLLEQLASADPDIERPMVGIALGLLRDPQAVDLITEGLRTTYLRANDEHHAEFAKALADIGTPEALAARTKWYQRI